MGIGTSLSIYSALPCSDYTSIEQPALRSFSVDMTRGLDCKVR